MRSDAGNTATCLLSEAAADEMDSWICTLILGIPYSGEMFSGTDRIALALELLVVDRMHASTSILLCLNPLASSQPNSLAATCAPGILGNDSKDFQTNDVAVKAIFIGTLVLIGNHSFTFRERFPVQSFHVYSL